jgi:hypothetical protein
MSVMTTARDFNRARFVVGGGYKRLRTTKLKVKIQGAVRGHG